MLPPLGRSRGLLTLAGLLLCVSLTVAYPYALLRGSRYGYSRNINPSKCYIGKERGVCMFAWNCMKANGTHLGTCMDSFYFGSCCKLQHMPDTDEIPDDVSNQLTNEIKPLSPSPDGDEKQDDDVITQGEAQDDSSESSVNGEGAGLGEGGGGGGGGEEVTTLGSVGQEIQSDGSDAGYLTPEIVPPGGGGEAGSVETSDEKKPQQDDGEAAGGEAVIGETETSGEKESGEKVTNDEAGSRNETTEAPEIFPSEPFVPTSMRPGQGEKPDQPTGAADDGEEAAAGTEDSVAADPSPSTSSPLPTTLLAEQSGSAEEDAGGVTEVATERPTEAGASGVTEGIVGVTEDDSEGVTEGATVEVTDQVTTRVTEGIPAGDEEAGTTETPGTQTPSSGEEDDTGGPTEAPGSIEDTEDDSTTSTPVNIYTPAPVGAPGTEQTDQDTTESPLAQTTLREDESSQETTEEIITTIRTPVDDLTTIVSTGPSATTLSPTSGEVDTTISSVSTQETTIQSVPPSTIIPVGSSSEEDTSSPVTSPSTTPQETTTTEPSTTRGIPIVFPGPSAADVTTELPEDTERTPIPTTMRPLVVRPVTKPSTTTTITTTTAQDSSEVEGTEKPTPETGSGESSTTTTQKTPTTTEQPTDELLEKLKNAASTEICGKPVYPTKRIVGGNEATFGEWPWQVSLRQWRHVTFLHKCGAALVNRNWAITAAHCVENVQPEQLLVRLGEFDLETSDEPYPFVERKVQIVASHPKFEPRTFEYDLALLRFDEPIDYQPNIIPICIPQDDYNFLNDTGYVTGWGRLYEDGPLPSVMQKVPVPVITNDECEEMYKEAGFVEDIPNIFICAGYGDGGRDSCEGDSGGPLVIQRRGRWRLAGVISWGIGCALPNQPGVYTRISEFREWVDKIVVF
ncbi:serine proteinase stubble-like isoform X1 [Eriocheir sinensis]|uniref:serine proteinase stubble-like isoform X1 n=1 Tax=Eriocheir sinensis TaxID=95602 RepID=UPI0021C86A6F|nr:serine proteinase stubble-like isoform X1 [Eriocheir sinensis]XP_050712135.1 serine proteinase stubble-like isoform X1 [Eriocheir sinensis]